jgi:hypothetical protein
MRRILSVDGGGIRGVIPAMVLSHIEEKVGPAATHFDLISGTSTGGIIALALACPNGDTGEPLYTARELVELYEKRGPEIFHTSTLQKIASGFGLLDEKYSSKSLEKVLADYFGHVPLSAALTKVLVSAYDIQSREPFFFKSWREENANVEMRLAARATSAAPTYFEPALITAAGSMRALVDGGVFINNPAVSAYAEARKVFADENEFIVVALGTGLATQPLAYKDARNWGLAGWARPVLDVVFDGVSDAVDYQMKYLIEEDYFRFQTDLAIASHDLGDATAANIDALKLEAEKLIQTNRVKLDQLCERLKSFTPA